MPVRTDISFPLQEEHMKDFLWTKPRKTDGFPHFLGAAFFFAVNMHFQLSAGEVVTNRYALLSDQTLDMLIFSIFTFGHRLY